MTWQFGTYRVAYDEPERVDVRRLSEICKRIDRHKVAPRQKKR